VRWWRVISRRCGRWFSTTNEKYKLTLEREEKAAESDESKRQAEQQELDEVARKVWGALHDYD
jgi:hypothetical protein